MEYGKILMENAKDKKELKQNLKGECNIHRNWLLALEKCTHISKINIVLFRSKNHKQNKRSV